MSHPALNQRSRLLLISTLLIAVFVRALVPSGFMLSAAHPLTLEFCPDAFPSLAAHTMDAMGAMASMDGMENNNSGSADGAGASGHSHAGSTAEHCLFAAAAGSAPPPLTLSFVSLPSTAAVVDRASATSTSPIRRFRLQQPRAPPSFF